MVQNSGLPRWLSGKNLPINAEDTRDAGLIPGSGRSPGGGNGNPLRYSCLGNPMDRGAWWAIVHSVPELDTIERAHVHTHIALYTAQSFSL